MIFSRILSSVILISAASWARPPLTETRDQRDARMQWWREARFGMFVHWGLYSGLAGTWEGKLVGARGGMEWIQERVKADTGTYAKRAIPLFQPKPGFAREWARLARQAGCRYVVFTSKHHDGFALHDSKVSDYDAGSVLQRDLVREIVDALRAEGLRVGFYHSVIDWHHDQYEYGRSKQLPHPLKESRILTATGITHGMLNTCIRRRMNWFPTTARWMSCGGITVRRISRERKPGEHSS